MSRKEQTRLDVALLLLRTVLGIVFVYHGAQKLFGLWGGMGLEGFEGFLSSLNVPIPAVAAVAVGLVEFGGGIVLILGTGAVVAAVPMVVTMLVAILTVHAGAFGAANNGIEFPLTLAAALAAVALLGPGRLTLDRAMRRPGQERQG